MDALPESDSTKEKYPQTSTAWKYFKNICRKERTAVCKLCGDTLSYTGTVSNLKRHLQRRHGVMVVSNNGDDENQEETMEVTYLEEDEGASSETDDSRPDKRKLRRSEVWSYFEVADEEQRLANCQLCNEEYSYRTSSSNLAKHLKRRHNINGGQNDDGNEDKERKMSSGSMRSQSWEYFTIKDPQRRTATCKICDTEFSYMTSVSNLMKHVRRKHGMGMCTEAPAELHEDQEKETSNNKNRSSIWLYFKKLDKRSGIAVCLICKKRLKYWSSITNLKRHLDRKHPHVKLDGESDSKKMLISSDGQLYEIEDHPKQEIIDDDDQEDEQDAEPMQQIYLEDIEGNVLEKASPRPVKKVKRVVTNDSTDSSDDEVTLKKRYVRKKNDTLDKFGKYLVSLLRQLPREVSNQLQADFVKQTMNCQNNDSVRMATIAVPDNTITVSSVSNDNAYVDVQTTIVDDNSDDEEASSPVWSYFERDGAGKGRARCAICCARVYNHMSSLTEHLRSKHPKVLAEMSPQGSEQQNEQEYEEEVFTDVIYLEDDTKESPAKKDKIEILSPKNKPSTSRYTERKRKNSQSSDEIVYKKKRNETKIDRRHTTAFVTKQKDNNDMEIESFGTYVICLLKKLPRQISMKLQRDIINLIMNANLSEESNEISNKIVLDQIYTLSKNEGTSTTNIDAPATSENHRYSIAVVTENENQDSDAPSIKILG